MNQDFDMDELLDVEEAPAEQPAEPVEQPEALPELEPVPDLPVDEATVDLAPQEEEVDVDDLLEEQPEEAPVAEEAPQEPDAPAPIEEPVQKEKPAKKEKPPKEAKPPKEKRRRKEKAPMAGRFLLADGEEIRDSYGFLRGGTVYVTNRRLLFDAYYRADISIDKVQGVSAVRTTQMRWGKLILGLLFVAICAAAVLLFLNPDYLAFYKDLLDQYDFIQWIVLAVGGVFGLLGLIKLCKCGRRHFAVNIITDSVDHAISIRNATAGRHDQFNTVIWAAPGSRRELNRFLQQFGARLAEIKQGK